MVLHLNKHMIKQRAVITNETAALPYESAVSWQHLFSLQVLISFLESPVFILDF